MPFKRILNELVSAVPGADGAILADWEGEAVEQWCIHDDYELKLIGAHKGIILNLMREAHSGMDLGVLRDAIISTENQRFIIGAIGPDYVLVMTLGRGAVVGRALYCFRRAVPLLAKEIY